MKNPSENPQISKFRRYRFVVFTIIVVLIIVVGAIRLATGYRVPTASGAATTTASVGRIAPPGVFTTTSYHKVNLRAYFDKHLTMVWFIAGGCASCAASIPTVAHYLRQLNGDGVKVVTLGLYGAFTPGKQGVSELITFGTIAAGRKIPVPDWTWGIASKTLSMTYDPSGTPDEYFLVSPNGHIVYQNSVPVSTMPQLLSKIRSLR